MSSRFFGIHLLPRYISRPIHDFIQLTTRRAYCKILTVALFIKLVGCEPRANFFHEWIWQGDHNGEMVELV